MRTAVTALLVLFALAVAIPYPKRPTEGNWRLLQFSDEHVEWIPEGAVEEAADLIQAESKTLSIPKFSNQISKEASAALTARLFGKSQLGVGFIDRTLHYESGASSFESFDAPTPDYPTPDPSSHAAATNLFDKVKPSNLKKTVVDLSTLVTRFYLSSISKKGPAYLTAQLNSIIGKAKAKDVVIKQVANKGFDQNNVVAIVPAAADKKSGDDIVIVGGHLDSTTGGDPEARAPGADDDASGSAIVLETFRLLVESGWRGSRDVHFMFFAAEEGGLLGSSTVAKKYKADGVEVRAMLQMEMCGYQKGDPVITVLSDPNPKLSTWLSTLVDTYLPNVTARRSTCGYGCSDHDSFDDVGYPSACISEAGPYDSGLNPNMHTTGDVASILNFDAAAVFVRAGLAWVVELAQ